MRLSCINWPLCCGWLASPLFVLRLLARMNLVELNLAAGDVDFDYHLAIKLPLLNASLHGGPQIHDGRIDSNVVNSCNFRGCCQYRHSRIPFGSQILQLDINIRLHTAAFPFVVGFPNAPPIPCSRALMRPIVCSSLTLCGSCVVPSAPSPISSGPPSPG